MTDQEPQRLQKILAAAGFGSRREIETWIQAGRVSVNGETASLGQKITRYDRVQVDGKPVTLVFAQQSRVLAYNKPVGEICTRNDPGGRPTVFDNLPQLKAGRWINVGRLDINSCGLILFTTDGKLADALMRPATGVIREYMVRVLGEVSESMLQKLRQGVVLDDGPAKFSAVEPQGGKGANRWYRCKLQEGRKREVRRIWEAVGGKVNRLIRTRYGSVRLPRDSRPGQVHELDARAQKALYRVAGLDG